MTRARPQHFSDIPAIFETFITLLGFQCRKLQICKASHEIMQEAACKMLCDVLATCVGLVQSRGGQSQPASYIALLSVCILALGEEPSTRCKVNLQ